MNPSHVQDIMADSLKVVELSSMAVKRACDEVTVHRQMKKKATDLAPSVLDLLVKTGGVRENERREAAAMLGDHAGTLTLLKNAAEEIVRLRTQKQAGDLGTGVDDLGNKDKKAGDAYDSVNDPFVGRPTGRRKQSDLAILAVLDR